LVVEVGTGKVSRSVGWVVDWGGDLDSIRGDCE
jgi:hypothetical protein